MPTYRVMRRVDAFADAVALVEADDPKSAVRLAAKQEDKLSWGLEEIAYFDARTFVALDDDGGEIPGSEYGDFD